MSLKAAILAYVPPPSFGCAEVFLENLGRFKTRYPILLVSDHNYGGSEFVTGAGWKMGDPSLLPHEVLHREDGKPHPAAISNAVFHVCLRVALANRVTHMLYLESDCRVNGDYWDEQIFDEYFSASMPLVAAGTLFAWHVPNAGLEFTRRWQQVVVDNSRKKFPIQTFGLMPFGENANNPAIFPNGALAVYSTEWLATFFDVNSILAVVKDRAFDYVLGEKLVRMFGADAFELVGHLNSVFSGYGEQFTIEAQRIAWLKEGHVCAVHQVKSKATV